MKEFFDTQIQPLADELDELLNEEEVIENKGYDTLGGILDPDYINYEKEKR